ncbi:MAG TPA: thioesterase family protein [Solirubrobacteraceae bacterium]|nr:thioesterase family protein [Solirubrobacteraceae bacterium]
MTPDAVFVQDGDVFHATDLALGPWQPGALHGGAPAALIVHAITAHPVADGLQLARITYEFVRPVPQHGLTVSVQVVRPGRRVTLLDAVLHDGDGVEVTRARALLLQPSEVSAAPREPPPFPGPEQGIRSDWEKNRPRMFATEGMQILFVKGQFLSPGDATAWFRLRYPLVAGQPTHPLEQMAAAGDFGNGISAVLDWDRYMFINPDLTVIIERPPVDEWVALESHTRVERGSAGVSESVMWDRAGRIGRAIQSLLVVPRPPAT